MPGTKETNRLVKMSLLKTFFMLLVIATAIISIHNMLPLKEFSKQQVLSTGNETDNAKVVLEETAIIDSPILKEALSVAGLRLKINKILKDFDTNNDIYISPLYGVSDQEAYEFLMKLQNCERCKKVFSVFNKNKIIMSLNKTNRVDAKNMIISINVGKSPEEIAKWLVTGKE